MKKIDLGCGKNKHPGCFGIDRNPASDADVLADLNCGIPLKDNSIDEVHSYNCIEHLNDLDLILTEIHRICKNGARVHLQVPHFWHTRTHSTPDHKIAFTSDTFNSYCRGFASDPSWTHPKLFRMLSRSWRCIEKGLGVLNHLPRIFLYISPFRDLIQELNFELEVVK